MKGTTMNVLRKVQRWLAAVAVAGMATGAGAQVHSADVGADGRISRAELLRVLELAQSDGFHCAEV
jgi:hypothetical protein